MNAHIACYRNCIDHTHGNEFQSYTNNLIEVSLKLKLCLWTFLVIFSFDRQIMSYDCNLLRLSFCYPHNDCWLNIDQNTDMFKLCEKLPCAVNSGISHQCLKLKRYKIKCNKGMKQVYFAEYTIKEKIGVIHPHEVYLTN